jgi:hypothetical protein
MSGKPLTIREAGEAQLEAGLHERRAAGFFVDIRGAVG